MTAERIALMSDCEGNIAALESVLNHLHIIGVADPFHPFERGSVADVSYTSGLRVVPDSFSAHSL
jgi:hypothetical protein